MESTIPSDRLVIATRPVRREIETEDGVVLAAHDWAGEGSPIVLVHGLASNALLWQGVVERLLAVGHRVVAVDLRGHGESGRPSGGFDHRTITADVLLVIDVLMLRSPLLVGQSWGGNVVVRVGAQHPDRVSGIVAVDGGTIDLADRFGTWNECRRALTPPATSGRRAAEVEEQLRTAHPDWPETGIQGTMACFDEHEDGTVSPRLSLDSHLAILEDLFHRGPADDLDRLGLPALFIPAGTADEPGVWAATRRRSIESAVASVLFGSIEWIDGDHDLHAQHPDRVARLIADFAGRANAADQRD